MGRQSAEEAQFEREMECHEEVVGAIQGIRDALDAKGADTGTVVGELGQLVDQISFDPEADEDSPPTLIGELKRLRDATERIAVAMESIQETLLERLPWR
jgi:hypothetical protein